MRKILTILLPVIVVMAVALAWYVRRTPPSPFDGAASIGIPSPDLIRRGEYAARASDCVACHSMPNGAPFAGGLEMPTPVGVIHATNITPDKETGIGTYSLADFDRALRKGVARDGHRLYPAMPYPSYAKLSDDDVRALYAFFMHGVRPVRQANDEGDIRWPLNARWPLALWNGVFAPSGGFRPTPSRDPMWNRGAYLVQAAGHCGACHSPRSLTMNEKGYDERSAHYLAGALIDGWYAPSLRGDFNTGLARWSEQDIHQFLKAGRNRHGVVFGSMADAFNNSTQFLTDADLRSIAHYLKSLPGDRERDGTPWRYDPASNDALVLANRARNPGAQIYMAKCSFCHGQDGRGKTPWIPPLAGTASSMANANASSINIALNGSARLVASGVPDAYRMPPMRAQLSDAQIADVLTFIRTAWGNKGGPVTPKDVKALRDRTHPASSTVTLLSMR